MKVREDRLDVFVGDARCITREQADDIIHEFRQDGKDALGKALSDIKDYALGNDDRYLYEVGVKEDPNAGKPKGSKLPIIIFLVGVVSMVIFSFIPPVMIMMFFGMIGALGIYSLKNLNQVESESLIASKKAGPILMVILGVVGIVSGLAGLFLGLAKCILLLGILMFISVGIFFVVSIIWNLNSKKFKYKEKIYARCVGYARRIRKTESSKRRRASYYLESSPIFEYDYKGEHYRACYDVMTRSLDCQVNYGENVLIDIDAMSTVAAWGTA